jgi:hypothetical protein
LGASIFQTDANGNVTAKLQSQFQETIETTVDADGTARAAFLSMLEVNGKPAGFGFDNDGHISNFFINADRFAILGGGTAPRLVKNILPLSSFTHANHTWSVGWKQSPADADARIGINLAGTEWSVVGANNMTAFRPGTPTGVQDFYPPIQPSFVPSGKYVMSAYMAAHRCTVDLGVACWDANGNVVHEQHTSSTIQTGGTSLSGWERLSAAFDVPYNMATAMVFVRMSPTGGTDPYAFWMTPMVEPAVVGQIMPSDWTETQYYTQVVSGNINPFIVDNGSTYINSAVIKDASIDTAKIRDLTATIATIAKASIYNAEIGGQIYSSNYNNTIKTGWSLNQDGSAFFGGNTTFAGKMEVRRVGSGAGVDITNEGIRVYDESGTLRVAIGKLA